jgi:hypothetical protein
MVTAHGTVISGYAVPASVDAGGEVGLAVSTSSRTYGIDVYRLGWYGGRFGRLLASERGLRGRDQGSWSPSTFGVRGCRTCTYDARTGLLQPRWAVTHTVQVQRSWLSGAYVVVLTTPSGEAGYAYFVVRDDQRASDVLAVLPVNTYQAYNNWGGKSLYGTNSTGPATIARGEFALAATKVSMERPYASIGNIREDVGTIAFLEREGYDVTYATSVDLDRDPGLVAHHRIVMSVGHDEYWTKGMRDHVESARDHGTNLVFLGGNDVFWQARYERGAGGDRTVLVCYRVASLDPLAARDPRGATVRFVDPPLSRPQTTLTGTLYRDPILRQPAAWVVAPTAPDWLLAGTALAPGGSVPGLVGLECDMFDPALPVPPSLVIVSESPVVKSGGEAGFCDTVYYRAGSGAQVFSAGTWSWEDFLVPPGLNASIVALTNNVLTHFGAIARPIA